MEENNPSMETKSIGTVSNFYGGLYVKKINNKYYWDIESYDGVHGLKFNEEIPEYLFKALLRFEKQRKNKENKN